MIEVAAGLVFRNGKLLITRRRMQDHCGGLWEFPGGKRENCESFEECLQRELREELGIETQVGALFATIRHDYPERSVHLQFYRCVLLGGEPQPIHCEAVAWILPGEINAYAFPAADARLLETLSNSPHLWQD
jgi:mutator protein MutT